MLALPQTKPDDFEAWLFTVAKYTLYDHYRKRKLELLPEDYEYFLPSADETLQKITQQESIRQVEKLNETLRKPLILYVRGYSYEEIATILKISPSTVKSRIFHARKKLRRAEDE